MVAVVTTDVTAVVTTQPRDRSYYRSYDRR